MRWSRHADATVNVVGGCGKIAWVRPSIVLVRHARSVPPTLAGPGDDLRPLTDTGKAQAERLAPTLATLEPTAMVSSPYLRAVQTLEPTGRILGMPIRIDQQLPGVGFGACAGSRLRALLRRKLGEPAVGATSGGKPARTHRARGTCPDRSSRRRFRCSGSRRQPRHLHIPGAARVRLLRYRLGLPSGDADASGLSPRIR